MATFRVKKAVNYSVISNIPLNDKNLSWKAKGILSYLLSKPDDWKIIFEHLKQQSSDGRDSTQAGINELIKAGYIKRSRVHTKEGKFSGYEYDVFENPAEALINQPYPEKPFTDNPFTEKPFTENPQLPNTDITNNLFIPNTDITNISPSAEPEPAPARPEKFSNKIYNRIFEYYAWLYETSYKVKPVFNFAKDRSMIKRLLSAEQTPEMIIQRMTWFFTYPWWFTKQGHGLGTFIHHYNEITEGGPKNGQGFSGSNGNGKGSASDEFDRLAANDPWFDRCREIDRELAEKGSYQGPLVQCKTPATGNNGESEPV